MEKTTRPSHVAEPKPTLFTLLGDLSAWCEKQPGAVTWTLIQTLIEGRRGVQLFIIDHEKLGNELQECAPIYCVSSDTLDELRPLASAWFDQQKAIEWAQCEAIETLGET